MQKTYRFLAYTIAVLVVVQAATIAWGVSGLSQWVDDGGVLNKAYMECESDCESFSGEVGFMVHGMSGLMLVPLISLIMLIVSFFAKIPGGVKYAATIFGLLVLQVLVLPELSRAVDPAFFSLHGLNALVILGVAIMAGRRVSTVRRDETPTSVAA